MKNLFWLVSIILVVSSCSNNDSSVAKKVDDSPLTIGIVDGKGNHVITVDQAQVKVSLIEEYKMLSVDYLKVYVNNKNIPILEAGGPIAGGKYLTIGKALKIENNKILRVPAGCTQTCTSVAPCNGCSLTIDSDCAGSCNCNSGFGGSCTHTVTSGGGA